MRVERQADSLCIAISVVTISFRAKYLPLTASPTCTVVTQASTPVAEPSTYISPGLPLIRSNAKTFCVDAACLNLPTFLRDVI
jgi:hypothetical protein